MQKHATLKSVRFKIASEARLQKIGSKKGSNTASETGFEIGFGKPPCPGSPPVADYNGKLSQKHDPSHLTSV